MANGNFGGGDGTALAPYLVEDADDFFAVRDTLALKKHYKQTGNIDFSGKTKSANQILYGTYDGNGFKLTNFVIDSDLFADTFFIYTLHGSIINLEIDSSCSLINKSSTSTVVGGFARHAKSTALIHNCINRANITISLNGRAAGFASIEGDMSNTSENPSIKHCRNYGNITVGPSGYSNFSAGIYVGLGAGRIDGCLNAGDIKGAKSSGICTGIRYISNCKNEGSVLGSDSAAGISILQTNSNTGAATLEKCINTGNIFGGANGAGGIAQTNYAGYAHVLDSCFSLNERISSLVASPRSGYFQRIFSGTSDFSKIILRNCYALDTMELAYA